MGIGSQAGDGFEEASVSNIIIGVSAGLGGSGDLNVLMGYGCGYAQKGDNNLSLGSLAGFGAAGDKNVYIGYQAGRNVNPGSNNIDITIDSDGIEEMDGLSSKLNIYNLIRGDASTNRIAIGKLAAADYTPDATLEVIPKEATDVGIIVQGDTSHSVNLTEWQNSSEFVVAHVAADGSIASSGTVGASGGIIAPTGTVDRLLFNDDRIKIGGNAGDDGTKPISIGDYAGADQGAGAAYVINIGRFAGRYCGGDYNVNVGDYAGYNLNDASDFNVCLGYYAGKASTCDNSIFIGYKAGFPGSIGDEIVAIGSEAGYSSLGDNRIDFGA